jgi:anti-sigma regulatory factor (Ser/Thr protein kinase)
MQEMTVNATPEQIERVVDFVNEQLAALGCTEEARVDVDVAVDELLGNIAQYAYDPDIGTVTVCMEAEEDPPAAVITFFDRGTPFNPLAEKRPDTTSLPAKERPLGGLGLFLVEELMDELTYCYRDGQNVLTVRKAL